jgi:integrase
MSARRLTDSGLTVGAVFDDFEDVRDLSVLEVSALGSLAATGSKWEPYRLLDPVGRSVGAVAAFFSDLLAAGRSEATVRSYGMDLLRWFRFLWAIEVAWDRATRPEARDFCRWLAIGNGPKGSGRARPYSVSVRVHNETVLRCFYDFHRDVGTGPMMNPFPLDRSRRGGRAHAHHNPMEPYRNERAGLYRPGVIKRIPRSIADAEFNDIFARLPSHRDRALVAFYVSTGARASELLTVTQGAVDPGRQLITVVRKGSREMQELPASTDAFVWLRLYQVEMEGLIPRGGTKPLWWTRRKPFRALSYHAAHRMFERVNADAGTSATLHALRHTAAYRMAQDPAMPLTDVQYVLGHAQLSTTQIYLTPRKEDVIERVLAHHAEQSRRAAEQRTPPTAAGYRAEQLDVLFARTRS